MPEYPLNVHHKRVRRHVRRNRAEIDKFKLELETKRRPDDFAEAYAMATPKVCGLYRSEAKAMWTVLRREEVYSIVEIGRNLGGGLFMLCCMCPHATLVMSYDIAGIPEVDEPLRDWMRKNRIQGHLLEQDSTTIEPPDRVFDLVFIDGDHTAEGVKRDIEIWEPHARLMAFHDFASKGRRNAHRRVYHGVVAEISKAAERYGWEQMEPRGKSEVVFKTRRY